MPAASFDLRPPTHAPNGQGSVYTGIYLSIFLTVNLLGLPKEVS
jgi:hypothetical protein